MPIQLIIRAHQDTPETLFAPGDAFTFTGDVVRLGSDKGCDCTLPHLPGQPPQAATLRRHGDSNHWQLEPAKGCTLELNGVPATTITTVKSGDHFQCGGHTIAFHKLFPATRHSPRSDFLAWLAKGLICLILAAETGAVLWLPSRVNQSSQWEMSIARQRVTLVLDELRNENNRVKPADDIENSARRLLGQQLDALALFLRLNQENLTRDQWRSTQEDIQRYSTIMAQLRQNLIVSPVPKLDVDAGFAVANRKSSETKTP